MNRTEADAALSTLEARPATCECGCGRELRRDRSGRMPRFRRGHTHRNLDPYKAWKREVTR